jgi:hypothetical protein
MDRTTKFHYKGIDYTINDCPTYPLNRTTLENSISSEFQDGYVTSRKRISRDFEVIKLTFAAVKEEDKVIIQRLEKLVGQADIFTWYPNIPLDPDDYNPDGTENIQPRDVRLVSPIQYDLIAYKLYNFDMNLQEAI